MRFLSLFSGIEAASEAWAPLGWECAGVAEIDPFACAVLAHRHPLVKNLGDITKITEMQIAALGHLDLIVFGSPCQDLSVAGKQKGLSGERSGLFYPAVDIISWARLWCGTRFALWENVPGAFSSNQGRDFAAVVGTLAGLDSLEVPPKGWGTEGCAVGDEAMVEWATLDAQWFGVAQRRRRIFALADFGNWAGRSPILLEPEGLRGDSAPSREAREDIAGSVTASAGRRGGVNEPDSGHLRPVRRSVNVCMSSGQANAEIRTDGGVSTLTCLHEAPIVAIAHVPCMPTLRSGGGSAASHGAVSGDSKDEYVVPVVAFNPNQVTSPTNRSRVEPGAPCPTLTKFGEPTCVAFPANLSGTQCASAENLSPSLCASNPTAVSYSTKLHNTDAMVPVAYRVHGENSTAMTGNGRARVADEVNVARCLDTSGGYASNQGGNIISHPVAYTTELHNTGSNNAGKIFEERTTCLDANSPPPALLTAMQVRRLTPVECERLQGFPDNHTQIPWRNKPADQCPDGPRYKALGNSMAVPVMRWIGQKIDEALLFQE